MIEKEKAEAYDKAIERAKKLYGNGIAEEIFPELKESDDERIRRWIINDIRYNMNNEPLNNSEYKKKAKKAIAWLEKQGDKDKLIQELGEYKVKYTQEILEKYITSMSNKDDERLRKTTIAFLKDFVEKGYENAVECIDWLEKQGKNSIDKIKPRFNVGDWVVFITSGSIYQVEKKENYEYTLKNIHGGSLCLCFSIEQLIREWTIQDAKDGDVIFYDEGWICIFKCIHGIWYSSYCFITDDGEFHTGYERHAVDSTIHGNAHPATKEQRDALMKAMNDAGYEWDSEKKELKKLDLVPNKKPILGGLNMKTYNDVNIGDTVYIWGSGDSSVDETTITEKHDDRGHWNLKFSNGCVGRALKNGTSSTMGMYACLVYSDKEAVRESINERIKILSNIKI